MSYMQQNPYSSSYGAYGEVAAYAAENERTAFIRKTYVHLLLAIFAFAGLETLFFVLVPEQTQLALVKMLSNRWTWLILVAGFVGVSWLAQTWASSSTSIGVQYLGLGLYVAAEAVIFLPILFVAQHMAPDIIPSAAIITALVFGGLTAMVFLTRADFSWMGRYLCLAGLIAMGVGIGAMFFGFSLGLLFSGLMVALACGYILYDTSNVLHQYRTTQHVAAALALFASVALLFWYVLRILMSLRSDD